MIIVETLSDVADQAKQKGITLRDTMGKWPKIDLEKVIHNDRDNLKSTNLGFKTL